MFRLTIQCLVNVRSTRGMMFISGIGLWEGRSTYLSIHSTQWAVFSEGLRCPRTPRMMYSIRLAQAGCRPKAQWPWWWLIRCLNGDIESMKEHGVTEGVNKLVYKWPSKVCYVVLSFRSSYFSVAFTVVFLQCELKMRLRFLNNHVRLTRNILEIKKLFILLEVHLNI